MTPQEMFSRLWEDKCNPAQTRKLYGYAELTGCLELEHHHKHLGHNRRLVEHVQVYPGTTVKVVMVSRFGDMGLTEDLSASSGYGIRVFPSAEAKAKRPWSTRNLPTGDDYLTNCRVVEE